MIRFLADENFDNDTLRGLIRRRPNIDLVRVQDVGLRRADDPTCLEWAATENRIVLTHDVRTMTRYAFERVQHGLPMPGVIEVPKGLPHGLVIDELLLIADCGVPEDFEGQVLFIPL